MNKPLIRKWVAALRSGKYHQTNGQLCEVIKGQAYHCCLGVACRVAAKNGIKVDVKNIDGDVYFNNDHQDLPESLMTKFGIKPEMVRTLVHMNDKEDKSFKEIANYIEEKLL